MNDHSNDKSDDKLMAAAAGLPTEIAPERDLWPDIEAAISVPAPQRRSWTPYLAQAAAVVLLVGGSSSITYMMTKSESSENSVSPVVMTAPMHTQIVAFSNSYELDSYESGQGFQDARNNLAAQLDLELDRLSPEARAGVEENLEVIRSAITEINSALEEEPDNVLLQDLLLKTYRDELAVMRNVGGLTQNVMSRNDI